MKTTLILAAVFAAGILMTTGCSTCCHKDGACCKPAVKCESGSGKADTKCCKAP